MKSLKSAWIILPILSALSFFYGITVIGIIGPFHWFNFIFIIASAVFAALFLIRRKIMKLAPAAVIAACTCVAIVFTNFAVFEIKAIAAGNAVPPENAKWVVVLGAKVNGTAPSLEFSRRIDAAAEYLKENPESLVILTGGQGDDEEIAESIAAKRAIISRGIDENRIYAEDKSVSTDENFKFAMEIITENGGSADDCVLIVSSKFHLFRAKRIAEKNGYTNTVALGSTGLKILLPFYYCREYAAYIRGLI